MKKFAFVLLLIFGFSAVILAQSGKTRPRQVETPSSSPTLPATATEDSSALESSPNSRKAKLPPTLRSSGSGGAITPAPTPQSPKQPATASSANEEVIEEDEVLRVETELVTIPVTVFDRQGRFVTDLKQTDFKVFEDGKEQEIAYLNATEQPFTVVLLLDVSPSTQFRIDEIQDAAISFVQQLKANDRVMVVSFNERIRVLSEPTSDRNRLYSAIRRADFDSGTSLYDAVDLVINQHLSRIEGRKAVILFSDGVDTTSWRSDYSRTLRDVEELDAIFYPVYYNTYNETRNAGGRGGSIGSPFPRRSGGGLGDIIGIIMGGGNVQIGGGGGGGAGTSRREYETGRMYVESLAARTGGRMYNADSTSNLQTAFFNIAEELRRQYSLGYYPTESGTAGQRKQVKVRVNRPDLIVRARDNYIVSGSEQTARK